ncbi:MAG: AbrB family transcriptional regulator [Solibacillus sp.]
MPIFSVMVIAIAGAFLFSVLNLPIPWMLGPLFAVLAAQFFIKGELRWPVFLRNMGLLIVGVAIGQAFELSLFQQIGPLLFYMFVINTVLVIFSLLLAWFSVKTSQIPMKTAVISSVPGGLSQLIVFAEEEQDTDIAVVTYFHVVRVIAVVMLIPFFVSGHMVSGIDVMLDGSWWQLALLLVAAWFIVPIAAKLYLPVPQFLAPTLFVILLNVFSVEVPMMPSSILHIAQLFIGAYIGLLLKPKMVRLPVRVLMGGIVSTLLLIGVAYVGSLIVEQLLGFSFATSFLSTAPGGLDQMAILATAVGADVSVVTLFQLFRILFIFLLVLPLLKWYYSRAQALEKL